MPTTRSLHPSTAPRTDRVVRVPDGRRIGVAEFGACDGPPVLLLHRSPGSRLLDPDAAATAAAGVRLVTVDRPGYGASDPHADPSRAVVAADVAAVAGELGLDDLALVGWSGGGQFAVEAAAALGDRVRSLTLLATPAPYDEVPWPIPAALLDLCDAVPGDPAGMVAPIREASAWLASAPAQAAAGDPSPADAATRERPGVLAALTAMTVEAVRQGADGMAFDIVAGSRRDPFPFGGIAAPVQLLAGDADHNVGLEHLDWWAGRLPAADSHVLAGAGHLLALTHWEPILAAALA